MYDPPGPISEALASYYVRHLVQQALDRAFTLAPVEQTDVPPAAPSVQRRAREAESRRNSQSR